MELKEGTFLQGKKYKIIKTLGKGGFGITYLAEQTLMDRQVCIKEFYIDDQCDRDSGTSQVRAVSTSAGAKFESFMQKFIKEAKTIARLDHPNIIRIYDVFPENGTAYYVMEYIDGQTLESYVSEKGRLSEEEAIGFIRQAATALDYIHKNRITHLDVKPANLMLKKNGRIVLIDFGVSKHYDEEGHQTTTTPIGISRGYAPLEQYLAGGVGEFSPETDVYSLGATLYRLVAGKVPTEAPMLRSEGLQFPDYVSENTAIAIVRAMQPDREERPASASAFIDILEGRSTTAVPDEAAAAAAAAAAAKPAAKKPAAEKTAATVPVTKKPAVPKTETVPPAEKSPKKSNMGLIIGIAAAVIAAAVALFLLLGRKPSVPAAPPVPENPVAVDTVSTPAPVDNTVAAAAENVEEKAAASTSNVDKKATANASNASKTDKNAAEKAAEKAAAEKAAANKAAAEKAAAEKAAAEKAAAEKAAAEKAAAEKAAADKAANAGKAATRVIYSENGLYGFKDGNGDVVVPATYANVWKYGSDGYAKVKASNNKMGLIDHSGKLVVPTRYNEIYPFSDGLARVYYNGRYGFVDTSGNEVIAPAYKDAYNFSSGHALVAKGSKWGFIDKTGTEKNFSYDYMSEVPGKVYLLRKGGLFGFCDRSGREVSQFNYSECKGYQSKGDGKYMYLMTDQHGEEVEVYEADLLE